MATLENAIVAMMKAYDIPMTREHYFDLAYLGKPPVDEDGELDPELEAELPKQFQLRYPTHEEILNAEAEADCIRAHGMGMEIEKILYEDAAGESDE